MPDRIAFRHWLDNRKLTLKNAAEMLFCTPQHLSKVLCGRARLTPSLATRMAALMKETQVAQGAAGLKYTEVIPLTVRFTAEEWKIITESLPPAADIEKTLRHYVLNTLART